MTIAIPRVQQQPIIGKFQRTNGWQGLFDLKPGATIAATTKPPMPPEFIDGAWNPEFKVWMEKWG